MLQAGTGLIFFLLEKQNRFVRFNALQSIMLSGAYIVVVIFISIISGVLPFLGFLNGLAHSGHVCNVGHPDGQCFSG